VDWIYLSQGRNKRRVLLNLANYTFEFHEMQKISGLTETMLSFQIWFFLFGVISRSLVSLLTVN